MSESPPSSQAATNSVGAGTSAQPLMTALASSNAGSFLTLARQFVHGWARALSGEVTDVQPAVPLFQFTLRLSELYLRGFEEIYCVLVPPFVSSPLSSLPTVLEQTDASHPYIVLCAHRQQYVAIAAQSFHGRAIIFPQDIISAILCGDRHSSREAFRSHVRNQISLLRLSPFNVTQPATGEMFFGRREEMEKLQAYATTNLLITGPTRIGKTSLVQQFLWTLRSEKDPHLRSAFYVDLETCKHADEDRIARVFAMHFRHGSSSSERIKFPMLRSFLNMVAHNLNGPLDIIIDEADAVCHTDLLLTVAEFATSSRSRLIVVGRGIVRRFWRKHQGTSFGRLHEIRCQALSADETWELFLRPIEALGLRIEASQEIKQLVLNYTSRIPHLVQRCGQLVIEQLSATHTQTITPTVISRAQDSFRDFTMLRSHLEELHTDLARFGAVEFLKNSRDASHAPERIGKALHDCGLTFSTAEIYDACDDLVINWLLGWEHANYATPRWDLCETARHHPNYLEEVQKECVQRLRARAG